jgi:hypothetical protein
MGLVMSDLEFSSLENQVLELLLAGEEAVLTVLREQIASAKIQAREFTGVGFYLDFEIPATAKRLQDVLAVKHSFCFGDVGAYFDQGAQRQEVGFLLWIKDGYVDFLEAYTYGLKKWPEENTPFQLFYFGNQRDFEYLRRNWEL